MGSPEELGIEIVRARALFRAWLSKLATDANAVMAASALYETLSGEERDAWISAIEEEFDELDVPRVALFAPFLSVEQQAERVSRMQAHLPPGHPPAVETFAGRFEDGDRAFFYIFGRHLDFVETLLCRLRGADAKEDDGVRSVEVEALIRRPELPKLISGFGVLLAPIEVDEATMALGHAVVADVRNGIALPPLLARFVEIFSLAGAV